MLIAISTKISHCKAISVCIFDAHTTGQSPTIITHPLLDLTLIGDSGDSKPQRPAKSASTKQSISRFVGGSKIIPRSLVPMSYRPILFKANSWLRFGLWEKRAHWWTAKAKSGLVVLLKYISIPITLR